MSWIETLRNDVATSLAPIAGPLGISVGTDWVTEISRESLVSAVGQVSPASRRTEHAARGCLRRVGVIGVMVADPIEDDDGDARAANAQEFVDQVELLLGTDIGGFRVTSIEQPSVVDPAHWREKLAVATLFLLTLESIT